MIRRKLKIAGIVVLALLVGSVIPVLLGILQFISQERLLAILFIPISMAWGAKVGWYAANQVLRVLHLKEDYLEWRKGRRY